MVKIRFLKTILFVGVLAFCQNNLQAQSEYDLIAKLFKGVPVKEPLKEIIVSIGANTNFKVDYKSDPGLVGTNGKDFFIGSIINFQGNQIFEDTIDLSNSISIVKLNNLSINSIVFLDTLDIISISFFYPGDKYQKFNHQCKKLDRLAREYLKFKVNNNFEHSDLLKKTSHYYLNDNDKLPFLGIERQARGYSKGDRWYFLSVLHYRYHK